MRLLRNKIYDLLVTSNRALSSAHIKKVLDHTHNQQQIDSVLRVMMKDKQVKEYSGGRSKLFTLGNVEERIVAEVKKLGGVSKHELYHMGYKPRDVGMAINPLIRSGEMKEVNGVIKPAKKLESAHRIFDRMIVSFRGVVA